MSYKAEQAFIKIAKDLKNSEQDLRDLQRLASNAIRTNEDGTRNKFLVGDAYRKGLLKDILKDTGRGALFGGISTAAIGALIGAASSPKHLLRGIGAGATLGGLEGSMLGGLVGANIGINKHRKKFLRDRGFEANSLWTTHASKDAIKKYSV